ncbi:preprotein translocase subunit SecG [Silicimonas algicola]|uniref:Protein-export membrane protein SecG n=1 Tax=Silicimonas algicola TaxID=1826607 RepID=A0A316G8R1_9RHOB|nr:preprotein translocase subunit SecG [Silicimonas algicola]AZQ67322.1 preprotein translocase subunit SecG [Silicimonas algicola]PWK57002.1 protein translocase subunit secG [Silicimonas algicola]
MENVLLIVHMILALGLIGVVLLQRSEGGGLGLGGGGGGGLVSARGAATALGKVTWALAIAFIATSIALTIVAAQKSASGSVLDRFGVDTPSTSGTPDLPAGGSLLPPVPGAGDATPGTSGGAALPPAD